MTSLQSSRGPVGRIHRTLAGRAAAGALLGAALLAAAPAASAADEGGPNTVYLGVAYLQVHSSLPV